MSILCETATKVQNQTNTSLPLLKKQYGDTLKSIENLLNAIQQGILTPSTKQRMEQLEQQKTELSIQIIKEEMTKPIISAEDIEANLEKGLMSAILTIEGTAGIGFDILYQQQR